jgi:hypothetical protein
MLTNSSAEELPTLVGTQRNAPSVSRNGQRTKTATTAVGVDEYGPETIEPTRRPAARPNQGWDGWGCQMGPGDAAPSDDPKADEGRLNRSVLSGTGVLTVQVSDWACCRSTAHGTRFIGVSAPLDGTTVPDARPWTAPML